MKVIVTDEVSESGLQLLLDDPRFQVDVRLGLSPQQLYAEIGAYEAGVLLELVKDMLYQAYVRKGKLQQAMMVRKFFADETLDKITPIGRAARD